MSDEHETQDAPAGIEGPRSEAHDATDTESHTEAGAPSEAPTEPTATTELPASNEPPAGGETPTASMGWPQPETSPTWSAQPAAALPTTPKPRGLRATLVAGITGGLVGALVASGVFIATKDDDKTTTVTRPAAVARNTSVIAEPTDIQGILAEVLPGVVSIQVGTDLGFGSGTEQTGAGSGFVISADGVVVTNFHVIDQAEQIQVTFQDGTQKAATVLGKSRENDLAVLKVDGSDLPFTRLGDSDKLQVGDDVIAIGNALALDGGPTVTKGIVSALNRQIDEEGGVTIANLIQTDTAINRGNSGGPLVNSAGEVVGINTAIADPSVAQNIGFAISISHAKAVIEDLREGKAVKQAFLGVRTQTVTAPIARELSLEVDRGAVVRSVQGGTPADDAGIQENDVIVKIDGKDIEQAEDVQAAIRSKRPKDTVEIELDRNGKSVTVEATLAERTESS